MHVSVISERGLVVLCFATSYRVSTHYCLVTRAPDFFCGEDAQTFVLLEMDVAQWIGRQIWLQPFFAFSTSSRPDVDNKGLPEHRDIAIDQNSQFTLKLSKFCYVAILDCRALILNGFSGWLSLTAI